MPVVLYNGRKTVDDLTENEQQYFRSDNLPTSGYK